MQLQNSSLEKAKVAAAEAAIRFVLPHMCIGLGSGSTATLFIQALGLRYQQGLSIQALATSRASHVLAERYRIPLLDSRSIAMLDLTVDGADEIDPQKQMIKGRGGALLKEKIVASMSKEMIVIADSSKLVQALGVAAMPVELIPFGYLSTLAHLKESGYRGELRTLPNGSLYETDNGNYICDIHLDFPCRAPHEDERRINAIPGVVGTGLFLDLASRIIIGYPDGRVEMR